jgi:DNA-binding NarL/FixJ family response regulator
VKNTPEPVNILLADDHTIVTDGLIAMLAGEQSVCIKGVASDGQMAVEMARLLRVDAVIMDADMPVMNGMDATRALKKEFPGLHVIILSMHDEREMIRMMLEAGADGYLLKTCSRNDLLTCIRNVMSGEKHIAEDVQRILITESSKEKPDALADLTTREIEILSLIAEGYSNKEIGERLFISHRTVDTHRTNLMQKLDIHNIAGLVRLAIESGLVR